MDGLLVLDKPAGPSSHGAVARVRRATGWGKVGHTGTLDPMATGVLPLVVGRATRLARFLSTADKEYEAEIRLGWATDTYDAEGQPIEIVPGGRRAEGAETSGRIPDGRRVEGDWPDAAAIETALARFRGRYLQCPPAFSAKKIEGVRAYALAREGRQVSPKGVLVTAHEVALLSIEADRVKVRVKCSSGFYVRSFAHDLGLALGIGAHLSALRRTRSGEYTTADAVPLAAVEAEGSAGAGRHLIPLSGLLRALPAVVVNQRGATRARHGNVLSGADCLAPTDTAAGWLRILDEAGELLAVGERGDQPGVLHPRVVLQ